MESKSRPYSSSDKVKWKENTLRTIVVVGSSRVSIPLYLQRSSAISALHKSEITHLISTFTSPIHLLYLCLAAPLLDEPIFPTNKGFGFAPGVKQQLFQFQYHYQAPEKMGSLFLFSLDLRIMRPGLTGALPPGWGIAGSTNFFRHDH
jgi:hypothetical protein